MAGMPRHSKFRVTESGVIELVENPTLRLNVQGGDVKPGDPLVLWPCSAQRHEVFEIADGMIRLGAHRAMCLNAHGGVQPGTNIVTWPCAQSGQPEDRSYTSKGIGRQGIGSFCKEILRSSTTPCRHMPLLVHF